jgi:large subunit ribosomal protein L25
MADGKRPSLAVEERAERGSRETRRLRRSGLVYGASHPDPVSFKVGARDLRNLLAQGSALFDVEIGAEKSVPVILKEQQNHPVRGEVMHVDLLEVRLDEKIQSTVAVELEGGDESPGVKVGGVVEHVTRELNIEALPTDIPDQITVDVSGLEVAATLMLSEIDAPQGVVFLDDLEETTIATVVVPTEVAEPEIEEETELVGEDGEPAEAAEGEEGTSGAEGASSGDSDNEG